ncbi:PEP-CTERM sorting domain-containing protein [Aquabacterium sp. A7-Y]|uniref:PEP-CTERM sorting domain-containing protein n=1 Tax=Aquabacterium sp. A7-Y TaxID=1349605 RepID=UPI00223CEFFB|nr:PEP-CTERM sorting domain-containing protein [Aquabacterium sp. A7-Y]MCW7537999.1 PEP-CTERM sorting domain-containing protein [Aquabacterium sp. A7-Y]
MLQKAVLGLALACLLPAAHADKVTAGMSNISITFTDLDPNDAYVPDAVDRGGYADFETSVQPHSVYSPDYSADGGPGTFRYDDGRFGIQTVASVDFSTETIQSSLDVAATGRHYGAEGRRVWSNDVWPTEGMRIAPNSRVTFSADAFYDVEFTTSCGEGACPSFDFSPWLALKVWTTPNYYTRDQLWGRAGTAGGEFSWADGVKHNGSQLISLSYTNTTNDWLYVTFESSYELRGQVGAVPEPETWALMVGGLGLLVAARRRSKAGAGSH